MSDLTLADLADQVLSWLPRGTKHEWGEELLRLAEQHGLEPEVHEKTVNALGVVVSNCKASRERAAQSKRLMERGVGYTGRPITPTLSVRGKAGEHQNVLWVEATPRQFIEAVLREQRIVDGRNDSNAIRLQVVEMMQTDEELMKLGTLGAVCAALSVDPDTLGLEELKIS